MSTVARQIAELAFELHARGQITRKELESVVAKAAVVGFDRDVSRAPSGRSDNERRQHALALGSSFAPYRGSSRDLDQLYAAARFLANRTLPEAFS